MSRVFAVAKELVKLSLAGEERDPLTNLRLQKLLYYAQAWSLVLRERELFPEEIRAWRYGPVVREVYKALPDGRGATALLDDAFAAAPDLDAEDTAFVRSVWEAYNQFSALKLARMTHEEMPWQKTWGDRPGDQHGNDPIPLDYLEEFFGTQSIPSPLAAYRHDLKKREEEAARQLLDTPPLAVDRLKAAATSYTSTTRP